MSQIVRETIGGDSADVSLFWMAIQDPRAWIREFDEKHPGIARQIQEARERSKLIVVEPYTLPLPRYVGIDNSAAPATPAR